MQLQQLAKHLGAELVGSPSDLAIEITQVAPIQAAQPGQVSFLTNPEYEKYLPLTRASAVIIGKTSNNCKVPQLVHKNPYVAFAKAAQLFNPARQTPRGISELAYIAATAEIGENVAIMPYAYIGEGVKIGDNVTIYPGVIVGDDCVIGDDSELRANVVLEYGTIIGKRVLIHANATLGADGFGFAPGDGEIVKIPQTGCVVVEDDVEIGALSSIDRAALGETRIGKATKLDSHVHIGHNVKVGHHTMISGMVGIAGSVGIGNWVLIGGHSGVSGHINIPDQTKIGAMTGVVQQVTEADTYMGFPAQPASTWRRQVAHLRRLADYEKRIRALEAQLNTQKPS